MGKKSGKFMVSLAIYIVFVFSSQAVAQEATKWNNDANSLFLNRTELKKLDVLESWKIKQMIWPLPAEIAAKSIEANEENKRSCVAWLQKFMKAEQLPTDLDDHLVAMKEWGLIRKESEQKSLCDVFITRFKKGDFVIHIQESSYNVIMTVSNERFSEQSDHKNLIVTTALSILNPRLAPDNSSDFRLFELSGTKISRAVWLTNGVAMKDKKGKRCANLTNASKNGAISVEAETNGRFVKFEIIKCVESPAANVDPYVKRFSSLN